MQSLKILNSKEKKNLQKLLKEQFDSDFELDFEVFSNDKNKIYLISKDIAKIDFDELRINNLGMYFGEIAHDELRLSIEGSQLIGKTANKNVLELNDEQAAKWMAGEDFEINYQNAGFVIIKNRDDFLGCGKLVKGKLLNYVPKERRI
jgi:NOL1/NOP2/fmu family ribosome biogenesis protein